jgi:hypothetical protein
MKAVASWNDLRPFGIEPLTGESCGLLMWRILFDVTGQVRKVVGQFFGVPNIVLAEPWNRGMSASSPATHPTRRRRCVGCTGSSTRGGSATAGPLATGSSMS